MRSKLRAHLVACGVMASGTACMGAFSLWPDVVGRVVLSALAVLLLAATYWAVYVAIGAPENDSDR